jgi:16S rRNA (cytidine1402-2'-O)-methyltransferase
MIASPIGNLGDITLRALEILKLCDAVACEDTRHTSILLQHYGISKKLYSCSAANEDQSAQGLIKLLQQGKMLAYLSDAGTPGLSDPGNRLVAAVVNAGFKVLPLPGPAALTCLLSVNPFGGRTFTFDGFLPVKSAARKRRLSELLGRGEIFVFYEAPHRLEAVLTELAELAPDRPILVGREMTKHFEEYLTGFALEILQNLKNSSKIKGEFVVLVSGSDWEKKQKKSFPI